ncbi:MAG: hypothetical protein Q8Q50_10165 [Methylobacter sp.]|nr:hypothetical protein [Methylobacter sp.]
MRITLPILFLLTASMSNSYAGPVEDLSAVLNNRLGTSSEDRRVDDTTNVLGAIVKTGCHGDVLDANVRITGVSGKLEGDTAIMTVTYSGGYTRQGWAFPCQKVSSNLGGLEEKKVSGSYEFRVTGKAFQKPTITWGAGRNFGEVTDPNHDSNKMAIRAVENAIASAF